MAQIRITTPLTREKVKELKAGDSCLISGVIYTARDAAHKRLCELVEQGKENDPQTVALLKNYLDPVKDSLDALVLGCTHYPFAAPAIREALGREIPLLDGGKAIARRTQQLLEEKQLLSPGNGELVWENTLGTPRILALSRRLLDTRIDL